MDQNRLNHSYSVAKKMMEIGLKYNLNEEQLQELFILGLNHDIGYEFTKNVINHNKIGTVILKNSGYKYWKEVYYHGEITNEYDSLYLNILNKADMQIDKYGNDVGYDERLKDIGNRHGFDSNTYRECSILIDRLKNMD